LDPILLNKDTKIVDLLTFYMGKNTPDRQVFIIDNLRVEKDLALDDPKTELEEVDAEVDA
jgi:topoisomerase-4 subunit B